MKNDIRQPLRMPSVLYMIRDATTGRLGPIVEAESDHAYAMILRRTQIKDPHATLFISPHTVIRYATIDDQGQLDYCADDYDQLSVKDFMFEYGHTEQTEPRLKVAPAEQPG